MAYGAVDKYVCNRVRQFLKRRHKVSSRGTKMYGEEVVFGELGDTQAPPQVSPAVVRESVDEVNRKAGCRKSACPV